MLSRSQLARLAALALVALLTGCHKKVKVATPPLPPITIPSTPMPVPATNTPEMPAPTPSTPVESAPEPTPAPAPTSRSGSRRPAPRTPAPAAKPTPAPAPATDIGNLSEGGTSDNASLRNDAQSLIADIDKRLGALSADTRQQKRTQLVQVQQFLQQAKDALKSGDPAGANNLATKSKLLLDDLLK